MATLDRVDFAVTDNRRTANLRVADRVKLQGLGEPSWEQDWLEPGDWRRGPGWGVPAP